jgi:hypothetical protein
MCFNLNTASAMLTSRVPGHEMNKPVEYANRRLSQFGEHFGSPSASAEMQPHPEQLALIA